MRLFIAAVLLLTLGPDQAQARDWPRFYRNTYSYGEDRPSWPTPAEFRQKAIRDQHTCAPVIVTGTEGRIVHPADGCR